MTRPQRLYAAALTLFVFGLSGCDLACEDGTSSCKSKERLIGDAGLSIRHDPVNNVTCYSIPNIASPGLSCIPDWMLKPGNGDSK